MEFTIRRGKDVNFGARPKGLEAAHMSVGAAALLGADYPGSVLDLRVKEGDVVRAGDVLCVDRHHPEITFTAPLSGRISSISVGHRRRIQNVVVTAEADGTVEHDVARAEVDQGVLRKLLLVSGLWTAFRVRPFGYLPTPIDRPSAIFVTAMDTNPLAADPMEVLAPQLDLFQRGTSALALLTTGKVFVCQAPGQALARDSDNIKTAFFAGPHPAGLAGTHIHHILPVSARRSVWQIGYQDVVAIGGLLATGVPAQDRKISVAGPAMSAARLAVVPLGSRLTDLVPPGQDKTELSPELISGSPLCGRAQAYLGRHDFQVSVLGRGSSSASKVKWMDWLLRRSRTDPVDPIWPVEGLERVFPFDILPVPLIRALCCNDLEAALRLGCLELLEEDLALLGWRTASGAEYGRLLRTALNMMYKEVAP